MSGKQTTFFDAPARPSTAERFAAFLVAHPRYPGVVIRMARERKAAGHNRWSMKAIFELTREKFPRGPGKFGLDNSFTSYMTRHVLKLAPDLNGFFELR